ncbi:type I restriction endonuclease subunit R [Streptomyces sp. H39-S7]|uniref:type I restriction endonuclease subunit R n=1 Tax=Streptomyces sp. H39-S7 TaxID=3004357 RepID=UPI0022AFC13B|nr:HsdR family type I site-specific deoxyribonuclease [Streptomyces sp. H39-S7]MCZ4120802.1 HsdR family type I site-specific deoxyribonuclease [Streptomyces sp. H39-S7]
MSESGFEYVLVEEPLITQLVSMGWRHERGSTTVAVEPKDAGGSLRDSFAEPVLERLLRRKLRELNRDAHGVEWLDKVRASQAVNALTRLPSTTLLEANTLSTDLLLTGFSVDGLPGWDSGREQRVQYIDWAHPERNDFLVVSQFRMDVIGTSGQKSVIPDLVLFVNGIPLVVVECKKPTMHGGSISQAIDQLRRYSNQRGAKTHREGSEPLFRTVQLTVATTGDKAMLGTYTSHADHYTVWRDPYPLAKVDLAVELGKNKDALWAQDILAAGVLRPGQLLDIVKNFVVFMDVATDEGGSRRVKIAPRYQQYRAVNRAVQRLLTGKTRLQDGKDDRRGGIVWHTQGSGKSLTMVFLVRKMRSTAGLSQFKIVLVTDRTQLQTQLSKTVELTSEKSDVVKRSIGVPAVLRKKGAGLAFVMLQKQIDAAKVKQAAAVDALTHDRAVGWGQLNSSESVLILVDEAHRSHGSKLHQNLMASLPNAARIGFTGTPIIMRAKDRTTDIFGTFIDEYRLADAEEDGAIVPIVYEGRIATAAIVDAEDLDDAFASYFPELTEEEYDKLQQRYATTSDVLSADSLILKKARDMLAHYVSNVMPNGFKGQVVAHSRKVAVRYRDALLQARDELVAEAERLSPAVLEKPAERLTSKQAIAVAAHRQKVLLKAIDFVPVISGDNNDDEETAQWTDEKGHEDVVERFLKAFPDKLAHGEKPVAFLIVRTMLLTGFDAPIEQVMYLDRKIKEADLLQAIARVNRIADGKVAGFLVDYAGISKHLQAAMDAYAAEDAEGAPTDFSAEIARLEPRRIRIRMLFTERGVTPTGAEQTVEECVQLLDDDELRSQFDSALRKFLTSVETVMPRREAKSYLADARLYSLISTWARARYQDSGDFDASLYGEKVRELIDEHITALGVKQVIPPRQLTAGDFPHKVEELPGAKAQASTMEHAIRRHIEVNIGGDPAEYTKLRERLEEILRHYADQWEQQVMLFKDLVIKVVAVHEGSSDHGDQRLAARSPLERALYGEMVSEAVTDGVLTEQMHDRLIGVADKIEDEAVKHVRKKNFWSNPVAQGDLRAAIFRLLINLDVAEPSQVDHLADSLLDILGHHRQALQRSN